MRLQKRLAAQLLNCGEGRIRFDTEKISDIKSAITKFDIQQLIEKGIITKLQAKGVSRARAKKIQEQKRKGRRSGHGSRKGKATARKNPKTVWVAMARSQRALIKILREKKHIDKKTFRMLYAKIKGGFFRSAKHIKVYLREQEVIKK